MGVYLGVLNEEPGGYIAIWVEPYILARSLFTFRSHLNVYPYIMYDCIGLIH